jgi:hypothetical protein
MLVELDCLAGILFISRLSIDPETSLLSIRGNLDIVVSPQLKEVMAIFIEIGKISISIGKIVLPLLFAGSIAIDRLTPQIPPQPDSIVLPQSKTIDG